MAFEQRRFDVDAGALEGETIRVDDDVDAHSLLFLDHIVVGVRVCRGTWDGARESSMKRGGQRVIGVFLG